MNKYLSLALSLSFLAPGVFAETKKVDKERENIEKFMKIHCYKAEGLNSCLKRTKPQFKIGLETNKIKGATSKKYTACNDWLQNTFPKDKMIKIDGKGKISRGDNATQTFTQDDKLGSTTAASLTLDPKSKYIQNGIEINVDKYADGGINISRKTTQEEDFPINPNLRNPGNMGNMQNYGYNGNSAFQAQQQFNTYNLKTNSFQSNHPKNTYASIDMKIGKNGKCYVSNVHSSVGNNWSRQADTKKCHDLVNFKKRNPSLAKCADRKVYKELKGILTGNKPLDNVAGLDAYTYQKAKHEVRGLSQEFRNGLGKIHELVIESSDQLGKCDENNLADFARDDALFDEAQAPVSRKTAGALNSN